MAGKKELFFLQSLFWYWVDVPKIILKAWKNFLLFNLKYWSVPLLLKTFFSPWRRYCLSYGKGFSPKRYFETFVFNTMSRVIGALFRALFIILGILLELFILAAGLIIFLGWLILPFILIFLLIFGLRLIFT